MLASSEYCTLLFWSHWRYSKRPVLALTRVKGRFNDTVRDHYKVIALLFDVNETQTFEGKYVQR